MARKRFRLNNERLSNRKLGLYPDGDGLYLSVTSKTSASWILRYSTGWKVSANGKRYGNRREMGLGSYPEVSLAEARERAADARKLRAQGMDPIAHRESERTRQKAEEAKAVTFRHCAEKMIDGRKCGWKNAKHAQQWKNTFETYAMGVIGDLPVGSIDTALVHTVLEPIWQTKTETASRVRGRIEAVLDWATVRGYRHGDNPARWRGHMEHLFPARTKVRTVKHHPALPYAELPTFFADVQEQAGVSADCLRFVILTAARTGEAIGAQWPEIDFDQAVWTVPAERMKAKREHRVPLSTAAVAILRDRHKITGGKGFIFPGKPGKPISNMAMLALLDRMNRYDITVHGFRSSFRDWVEETTSYAGSVAEAALAHVVGDKVEAAYRRGDLFEKRVRLMETWAMYCTTPTKTADVVPLVGRAA